MKYYIQHTAEKSTVVGLVEPSSVHPVPDPLYDTEDQAKEALSFARAEWLKQQPRGAQPSGPETAMSTGKGR
jgi:hypothetical protein